MKLGHLSLLGLVGYAGYKLYQNRDQVMENLSSLKESGQIITDDIDRIASNLRIIQDQSLVLEELGQDLTYKLKVFQQEIKPRLEEIQKHMTK